MFNDNSMNDNFNNKPIFNNNIFNNVIDNNDIINSNSNDLPPDLEEIKNLSDSSVYEAPKIDALGPANFINEDNYNNINDPLNQYDNYNLNINTINKDVKNNMFNSNDFQINNSNDNYELNNVNNGYELNNINNNFELNNVNNKIVNNLNNNLTAEVNNNMYFNKNLDSISNQENIIENKDYLINNDISINKKDNNLNNNNDNYVINNDISLLQKEDNLNDTESVDLFHEPDILEIIDIADEKANEFSYDKTLLEQGINKIKEQIDELKNSGLNISLEEFDFEEMYQIIIKFNKE